MKLSELVEEAREEMEEEDIREAKEKIKQRLREIAEAKALLNEMEAKFEKMLEEEV